MAFLAFFAFSGIFSSKSFTRERPWNNLLALISSSTRIGTWNVSIPSLCRSLTNFWMAVKRAHASLISSSPGVIWLQFSTVRVKFLGDESFFKLSKMGRASVQGFIWSWLGTLWLVSLCSDWVTDRNLKIRSAWFMMERPSSVEPVMMKMMDSRLRVSCSGPPRPTFCMSLTCFRSLEALFSKNGVVTSASLEQINPELTATSLAFSLIFWMFFWIFPATSIPQAQISRLLIFSMLPFNVSHSAVSMHLFMSPTWPVKDILSEVRDADSKLCSLPFISSLSECNSKFAEDSPWTIPSILTNPFSQMHFKLSVVTISDFSENSILLTDGPPTIRPLQSILPSLLKDSLMTSIAASSVFFFLKTICPYDFPVPHSSLTIPVILPLLSIVLHEMIKMLERESSDPFSDWLISSSSKRIFLPVMVPLLKNVFPFISVFSPIKSSEWFSKRSQWNDIFWHLAAHIFPWL